jgi:hypothetical protein
MRYLLHKGAFDSATRLRTLFKYGQSLLLLLTFAFRLRYRKVVLCGIDMNTNGHFYDDPELYPEARWATSEATLGTMTNSSGGFDSPPRHA